MKISLFEIHNSDQGTQFTADNYIGILEQRPQIRITMDGRDRCFDNILTKYHIWYDFRTLSYNIRRSKT